MPVFPPFQDDRGWVPVFWLGLADVDGRLEGWEVSSRVIQSEDGGTSGQVDEWTGGRVDGTFDRYSNRTQLQFPRRFRRCRRPSSPQIVNARQRGDNSHNIPLDPRPLPMQVYSAVYPGGTD